MRFPLAAGISAAWVAAALLFNAGVYFFQGPQKALEFLSGYVLELSLSIDNLFIFYLIFSHLNIKPAEQRRILSWGVLGAQLLRGALILAGVALLKRTAWMVYAFGFLICAAGVRLFFKNEKSADVECNAVLRAFDRWKLPTFWTALLIVEAVDVLFALDSIPAVLAITKDSFIVYSSNIFAILGLRAMYFVLLPLIHSLNDLHYALGIILVFVGIKMVLDPFWPVSVGCTLAFIIAVLAVFALMSITRKPKENA